MKGAAFCFAGLEDIAALDVRDILGREALQRSGAVTFPLKSASELRRLAYYSGSILCAAELACICHTDGGLGKTLEEIRSCAGKLKISGTFRVVCRRRGSHGFTSQDIAEGAGAAIVEKTGAAVNLHSPDTVVLVCIIGNECYIGIDHTGLDLSKRAYKVFLHPKSLNSTVAYSLYRMAGVKKGKILDPFCGAGTIAIEAALHSMGLSAHQYSADRFRVRPRKPADPLIGVAASDILLRYVRAAKHNAKLAGVSFPVSRMDIEWLDTKFGKAEFDAIVTQPPGTSARLDQKKVLKIYREFFHQAEFVLKEKGVIVLCTEHEPGVQHSFRQLSKRTVYQKKQPLTVYVLGK